MTQNTVLPSAGVNDDPGRGTGSVQVRNVVKKYGSATAVAGVDLDVHSGEFLSLLGPSGCGKTTLLRMIAGFEEPDTGDILLSGASVVGVPPNKRPINTVFQAYALFPHMTVAENVAYGLRQRRTPKAEIGRRVSEALELVQMAKFADRNPKMLSGGQQQRVALARAIVNRPKVLLLDEPMSALDRKLREEMQLELKLLQRQLGITFIFVTHDQSEALSMSDRIVVMLDGRVQQVGTAEEIYRNPENSFVAGFIGKQNFIAATVGANGRLTAADGEFLTSAAATEPAGTQVLAAVRAESIQVSDVRPDADTNVVSGSVGAVSFLGDVIQYQVTTGSGHELLARVPPRHGELIAAGTSVWCSWTPANVQVFPNPHPSAGE
ncbi:spermidine/putrescine ABC transporter ATP-binding protein [Arthrobacter sp. ERGS1:01]|uniref:ABC transporter ATP-binding protein n=1 Tax=Arthrobacter sp. ERGS1:01 TaxID=1704044 RepID=UPI0006B66D6C|nr:ABC transporter ATP-binding protein [Arthrobacter sp. ERGS1:01]ALE05895.1 spermidine/putrescine ABC transporter ATP-binding protein [Arthrobacter sp. ERGS1:01]